MLVVFLRLACLVCSGLFWFVAVCCGLLWFVVVCCSLLWFVVVCCGLSWFVFLLCVGRRERGVFSCRSMVRAAFLLISAAAVLSRQAVAILSDDSARDTFGCLPRI